MANVCRLTAEDIEKIATLRRGCRACEGDASACQAGTGEPHFERLSGCSAFTADGEIAAVPRPRQPWEPRPRSSEEQDAG